MARIAAVGTALPQHCVGQEEALAVCARACAGRRELARALGVFRTAGVRRRYFAFPPEYYLSERSFEERNRDYREEALVLAERAARAALAEAGAEPRDVDLVVGVTTTGLATPSLEALLVPRLGLRRDVRRLPLFGLGCAGGAAALARAAEAAGGGTALVVSVELAGQVFSPRRMAPVDVVGAALFGDGAAAAVVSEGGPGPRIVGSRSALLEGTQELMGWRFTSEGLRLELSPRVPEVAEAALPGLVDGFLAFLALGRQAVAHWILHPGGRRILEGYGRSLGLGEEALFWTRRSLAEVGNLSSASVLFVLKDLIGSGRPRPGERGLMCALGPGFAAELVLLAW